MMEHYKISKLERQKMFNESLNALGLKKKITSVNWYIREHNREFASVGRESTWQESQIVYL